MPCLPPDSIYFPRLWGLTWLDTLYNKNKYIGYIRSSSTYSLYTEIAKEEVSFHAVSFNLTPSSDLLPFGFIWNSLKTTYYYSFSNLSFFLFSIILNELELCLETQLLSFFSAPHLSGETENHDETLRASLFISTNICICIHKWSKSILFLIEQNIHASISETVFFEYRIHWKINVRS